MREGGALLTASQMRQKPALVRVVREAPLPAGMTWLLEVATGDATALAAAEALTGEPTPVQMDAAGFFVEQILFMPGADHYRVLGASSSAEAAELRHHMALLMRWVHPDAQMGKAGDPIDRSIFATRVTTAWQILKSAERRAAYDASLSSYPSSLQKRHRHGPRRRRRHGSLSVRSVRKEGWFSRLLLFLQGLR